MLPDKRQSNLVNYLILGEFSVSYRSVKAFLLGRPLETLDAKHERLPKWKALAVFSSDAMSSVAYATQEILIPLSLVSIAAANWVLPIGIAIAALLVIVSTSYWQTIKAYPGGGGAYIVVMDNLGTKAGLVTAAALLIDYVLTVAVSIAAGVEAIGSAFPFFYEHRIILGILAVCLVSTINLRGLKESSSVFAFPTYFFIVAIFGMIATGLYKVSTGTITASAPIFHEVYPAIPTFLILRAFASGCAALTGIEAISDGVPAFKPKEYKNAQITLAWMAFILTVSFLGITSLAHLLGIIPSEHETVVSLIARVVFNGGPLYYFVQFSTAMILFLAANTSYADFPRVCSLLARDRFMPRQLASMGDKLVFSNGIVLLGILACFLLFIFDGKTHNLIPLYAVGVFLSFTLSQTGMVFHHWRKREPHWRTSLILNGTGAVVTAVVLTVITLTKFIHGAWIVAFLIPLIASWFLATRNHYRKVGIQLALTVDVDFSKPVKHVVVLPISGVHNGVIDAIKYAKSISPDVRILSVDLDPESTARLKASWQKFNTGLELVVLPSPYRSVIAPILEYIRSVDQEEEDDILTVVIPEFVPAKWWQNLYHNQTAFWIRTALLFEKGKVVTSVRYHLNR